MKKNILVTGRPGCGKSTLIERVVAALDAPVSGFFTREIREGGNRVGFSVETFDGRRGVLAHVHSISRIRVGRYGVDIEAFEKIAIPSLLPLSAETLTVIDEIGRMECFSSPFRDAVLKALDSPGPVLASIAEKGDAFIQGIKSREDVLLRRITTADRDAAAASILAGLKTLLTRNR